MMNDLPRSGRQLMVQGVPETFDRGNEDQPTVVGDDE